MGLMRLEEFRHLLVCPRCGSYVSQAEGHFVCTSATCVYSDTLRFPIIDGRPVLVDFEQSILVQSELIRRSAASPMPRSPTGPIKRRLTRLLFGNNPVAERNAARYRALLKTDLEQPFVLIIGGATKGEGTEALYSDPALKLASFDIYASPQTQFIADAHQIPLGNQVVDAVWIQAVIEHVLNPWQVVEEIYRVLKPQGLVYAETPFMQQVHEGAYDFTRFTESGHRWLFRRFDLIDSGVVSGPGTALSWTVNYVSRGLCRSSLVGRMTRVLLFWARYLDRLVPEEYAIDSASGVFFLGRKSNRMLTPHEMVRHYKGAFRDHDM